MQKQIATWNTVRTVWETTQNNLFCGHWVPFLGTWTISGMTQNGVAYELQTQVHHTTGSEFLLSPIQENTLLRTPAAIEGGGGANSAAMKKTKGRMVMLRDQIADLAVANNLKVSDVVEKDFAEYETKQSLLPTPTIAHLRNHDEPVEAYLQRRQDFVDGKTKGMPGASLGVAVRLNWGKYLPAIQHWEKILDRSAPAPVKSDGKDGGHRLSAEFTEWLMGLPEGWVTDPAIGLKRSEQLKLCGNGVVPQQAVKALQLLGVQEILEGN